MPEEVHKIYLKLKNPDKSRRNVLFRNKDLQVAIKPLNS